jgi:hypothetical protein
MHKFSQKLSQCFVALLFVLALQSCKKDSSVNKLEKSDSDYFIDQNEASGVATNFNKNITSLKSKMRTAEMAATKSVASIIPVKGTNGSSAFYIIKYNGGGFSIVSADKRTMSVLAYSENGDFKTDMIPDGLNQWLYSVKTMIDSVRTKKIKYTGQDTISRNSMVNVMRGELPPVDPIDPENCPGTYEEVAPLVSSEWSQDTGYNDNCPPLSCGPNGHAYTGCSTTAIAQIVNYHRFPTSYNYNAMANTYATTETARLMGNIFNMTIADYNCDGSSSTMDKTVNTLRNLGYANSVRKLPYSQTSNYTTVMDELRANRPVIFSGGQQGTWFIFPRYTGGHEWVCDGFKRGENCNYSWITMHMNWGWGPYSYNGWFAFNNFNPASTSFNYQSEVIVGIHP